MIHRAELEARINRIRDSLATGVQVVSAPSLFPTPPDVAHDVVRWAGIEPGNRVLEPSAGTGALIEAVRRNEPDAVIEAVELNQALASKLEVRCADFLKLSRDELGLFDRVVMNPPFDRGADIRHIRHGLSFLKKDGRLVAICADGPWQRAAFGDSVVRSLPSGTFEGTAVRSCIVVIDAG